MAKKTYKWGTTSVKRMEGVDERLRRIAFKAIAIASRKIDGIDMTIAYLGGKRTKDEQFGLFEKKASRADGTKIVSDHQLGHALDIIPYVKREGVKGNAIYEDCVSDEERLLYFHIVASCVLEAAARLGIKIGWGGNWKSFKDLPHYYLIHP